MITGPNGSMRVAQRQYDDVFILEPYKEDGMACALGRTPEDSDDSNEKELKIRTPVL